MLCFTNAQKKIHKRNEIKERLVFYARRLEVNAVKGATRPLLPSQRMDIVLHHRCRCHLPLWFGAGRGSGSASHSFRFHFQGLQVAVPTAPRDTGRGTCALRNHNTYMRALETRDLGTKIKAGFEDRLLPSVGFLPSLQPGGGTSAFAEHGCVLWFSCL